MTQQRYGVYCTLAELKSTLAETTTTNDTALLDVLQDVARWIDDQCGGRFFGVETATKTFTAKNSEYLLLPEDDLLSITTLKTDEDDDWDYDNTWTTGDYHLFPFNKFPKWQILVKSGGDYSFPSQEEGVQIVGLWGHGDGESSTPYAADTTTAEELDASETGVDVTSGTNIKAGHTILAESEQMFVSSVSTNTLTVVRGVNGTTAATHATAKQVYIYRYPRNIRRACLSMSQQTYRLESGPMGVIGSPEMAVSQMDPREYARLMGWIAPYRRINIG